MSDEPVLHLCQPPTYWGRAVRVCPNCETRRRFVVFFQPWYGGTWTCCHCGDSYADGFRLPRPFKRAWRKEASAEAKRRWNDSGPWRDAARASFDEVLL